MAFDSLRGVTVLFGGTDRYNNSLGDTWERSGSVWTQRSASAGPQPSEAGAMVFDSLRGLAVMLASGSGNTWEWNGTSWLNRGNAQSPPPRAGHALAYDSVRAKTVLFGGYSGILLNDTWEFDGSAWMPMIFSTQYPSPRVYPAMAFDSVRNVTVMFGGDAGGSVLGLPLGDTWEWNGINWVLRVSGTHPAPRSGHVMTFDAHRGKTLFYGGYPGDSWTWDGVNWVVDPIPGWPDSRPFASLVYDSTSQCCVMFGGTAPNSAYDETWTHGASSSAATVTSFGSGCGQPPLLLDTAGSRPLSGAAFSVFVHAVPSNLAWISVGTDRWHLGAFSLPLPLNGYGLTNCWLLHNADVTTGIPCQFQGSGTASLTLQIPSQPAFLGMQLHLQAWAVAPNANPGGATLSNAVSIRLGTF